MKIELVKTESVNSSQISKDKYIDLMEFIILEFILMNNDYALWILFSVFVGIALSIDLGLFGKLKNIIMKQKKRIQFIITIKTYLILIMNHFKNYNNNKLEML